MQRRYDEDVGQPRSITTSFGRKKKRSVSFNHSITTPYKLPSTFITSAIPSLTPLTFSSSSLFNGFLGYPPYP